MNHSTPGLPVHHQLPELLHLATLYKLSPGTDLPQREAPISGMWTWSFSYMASPLCPKAREASVWTGAGVWVRREDSTYKVQTG